MAKIIQDERQDVESTDQLEMFSEEEQVTPEPQEPSPIPEKYQNKSAEELVQMHQEAEKLLGRQSSEVGELRKVVDNYIQTQLTPEQQAPQEVEEIDSQRHSTVPPPAPPAQGYRAQCPRLPPLASSRHRGARAALQRPVDLKKRQEFYSIC